MSSELVEAARAVWQEAVCRTADHTFLCVRGCTVTGGVVCPEGLALRAADEHAWSTFYEVRGPDRESESAA